MHLFTTDAIVALVFPIDTQLLSNSIVFVNQLQDYGPKANFKRHKVQMGDFNGLPSFIKPFVARITSEVTKHFIPVELCCLDYRPERGACIDPHRDDCWLWGNQLLTLNLLSDTTLTFSPPTSHNSFSPDFTTFSPLHNPVDPVQIEVVLPRRSLVLVGGSSRYHWEHSIQRHHVTSHRVAITLRELAKEFLPGGRSYETTGKIILDMAANFDGQPTNRHRTVIPE